MPANISDAARLTAQGPGLLAALRRYAALVVICIVVAAGLGILVTYLLPKHYTAEAQLVLGDNNSVTVFRTTPNLNPTAKAQNAAQVARSQAVHDEASKILKGRLSSSKVKNTVSATPGQEGNPAVSISATEGSRGLARDAANAVGRAYLTVTRQQVADRSNRNIGALSAPLASLRANLQTVNDQRDKIAAAAAKKASSITSPSDRARDIQSALDSDPQYQGLGGTATSLTQQISQIQQKVQETRVDAAAQAAGADVLYTASKPSDPLTSDLKRNALIAAAIGLLIGAVLAWRRLDRDRPVDAEQVAAVLGAPVLGSLKRERELRSATRVIDMSPGRPLADDLRVLAATLLLHGQRRQLRGIVVTSAESGEGKTVLALNLAAAAHSAGHEVVLVDGDVRNANLTRAFGLEDASGLVDLVHHGRVDGDLAQVAYGGERSLPVLPTGQRDAQPLDVLPALRDPAGAVPIAIVDTPAVSADPVALLLASGGAGLLVMVSRASSLDDLQTLRARADLVAAPIIGFVTTEHRPGRRRRSVSEPARHGQRVAEPTPAAPAGTSSGASQDAAAVPGR